MKNKATRNNMRGFSLMEMLVTVLILVILFALAMIPIRKTFGRRSWTAGRR